MALDQNLKLWNIKPRNIKHYFIIILQGTRSMQHTGIVILLILFRLQIAVGWTSKGGSFNVNFDQYDLELRLSGSQQFDMHNSKHYLIEFTLNSYDSAFNVVHMCSGGRISNVPVPASNERIWRLRKTSSEMYLYCNEVLVGHFSRSSSWSCLSDDDWENFGQGLHFYDDDRATTHYRLVSSEYI